MKIVIILLFMLLIGCSKIELYSTKEVHCDNITEAGEREICYNNLAIQRFDPGICMKIQTESYREWCLGVVKQKPVSNQYKP